MTKKIALNSQCTPISSPQLEQSALETIRSDIEMDSAAQFGHFLFNAPASIVDDSIGIYCTHRSATSLKDAFGHQQQPKLYFNRCKGLVCILRDLSKIKRTRLTLRRQEWCDRLEFVIVIVMQEIQCSHDLPVAVVGKECLQ